MRALTNNGSNTDIVTFSPHLRVSDPLAAYWLRQVTVRLRREVCWCRHERGVPAGPGTAPLPPFLDKPSESLDLHRQWQEKQAFFAGDATAKYLGQQLNAPPPDAGQEPVRGSFGWVVRHLHLDRTAAFVLALGLAGVFDSALGSVVSLCLNDPMQTRPTLALAQKLWDEPEQVLRLADPAHPLFRFGLIQPIPPLSTDSVSFIQWETPIAVPALVANQLLLPDTPLPMALTPITGHNPNQANNNKNNKGKVTHDKTKKNSVPSVTSVAKINFMAAPKTAKTDSSLHLRQVRAALNSRPDNRLRIVPVSTKGGSAALETLRAVAAEEGLEIVQCSALPGLIENRNFLETLCTYCWLKGVHLYLGEEAAPLVTGNNDPHYHQSMIPWLSVQAVPMVIFLNTAGQRHLKNIPSHLLLPKIEVPGFTFRQRSSLWRELLASKAKELEPVIDECSRRFRYEKETIRRIAEGIKALPGPLSADDLLAACRTHLELDLGDLAQPVIPRFKEEALILPHHQHQQFLEVLNAMRSLTRVHYEWGTARAWNESGISVLFAGPPGTGKTMAAEILALELDLPIFRIDLSQVVNKYIGETEKNLKRLFDAADISDMVLFFDEADSLFGRRTEVKDAHDRYANLEISYLLERMERFKGLAILATNRKKDLDEAFLRRLRYIIDFPYPGSEERKNIWQQVIPAAVDRSAIDIDFLALQFQLTGGHIRSIVFNACLQAAQDKPQIHPQQGTTGAGVQETNRSGTFKGVLSMEHIIRAVKREFDKMDRVVNRDLFGPYAGILEKMETKN